MAGSGFQAEVKQTSLALRDTHDIQTGSVYFGLEVSRASDDPPLAASKETPKWFFATRGVEKLAIPCGRATPIFSFQMLHSVVAPSPGGPCEAQLLTGYTSSLLSSWQSFSFRFTCSLRTKHVQGMTPLFPS